MIREPAQFPHNLGLEAQTLELRGTVNLQVFHGKKWWSRWESNPRPLECDSSALPTELRPHLVLC
jgi:hypothetical protein